MSIALKSKLPSLVASYAILALAGRVAAQNAVLLNGTILTPKAPVEIFATEGPIWNLDLANQGIVVTGKTVTIPATLNGVPLAIFGSSVLGQDGTGGTGITAATFGRLVDTNAAGADRDVTVVATGFGPRRLGPTRSLFSTSEGRRQADAASGVLRDSVAQSTIEQNYFNVVQACYQNHSAALPVDFLDRAGLRGTDAANWVYPTTAGGTLKSAGQVYVDQAGNEFMIPDVEVVIELSENVAGGTVLSAAPGNATTPDSFVIGELLVIFNQDPRFGADVLGLGEAPIPRSVFFNQVVPGVTQVDTIGHMVGEHVLFVQEVLTEFTDPSAGIVITAERFRLRQASGEARWRGTVDKPTGINLFAIIGAAEFVVPLVVDPITGGATYDFRQRGVNLAGVTTVTLEARDVVDATVRASVTFDVTAFFQ